MRERLLRFNHRLAGIEARLAATVPPPSPRADVATLIAAECVDEWRRLCHRPTPQPKPCSPAEEAAIVAAWRALKESQRCQSRS
jgi:hypothetical protein